MAALEFRASAEGSRGSMAAVAQAPLGMLWLALMAAGLICFAGWRAMQGLFDADRRGRTPKALALRAGQLISGLIYSVLALSLLELLDEIEDLQEQDEEAEVRAQAAVLLDLPYGQPLLIGVGLFVIGAGIGNIIHAIERRFHSDLECSAGLERLAKPIGRAGYIARGAAFCLVGFFLTEAGLDARSADAHSLGGALQTLESQPGGSVLLLITAAGLIAFGVFGLIEARYREVRAPRMNN
jgi:hypothetical protein